MKTIPLVAAALIVLAFVPSCKEGPTGAHPGHELVVKYNDGILKDLTTIKSAEVMVSGDSIVMQTLPLRSDTIVQGKMLFEVLESGVGISSAELIVNFATMPSTPGSYAFTAAKATAQGSATVATGVILNIENGTFYATEGTIVITEARVENGLVKGYSGYINGKLKSVWPKGFNPGIGGLVPPGFDISNPSLIGEELTLHSCPFKTRSNSSVPVIAPID
ncbi:MAG: hypothetical protein SGJ05_07540 [bacterium]|nr:hypothetical protein [bacterium]